MTRAVTIAVLVLSVAAFGACGGDDDDGATATPGRSATASSGTRTPGTSTTGSPTPATAPRPEATSGGNAGTFDETQARSLLDEALLKPVDLPGEWSISTDDVSDNAKAAADDPEFAATSERCQRLLGRTVVNMPGDLVGTFIAGQTVSFFSTGTVYATDAGAADCAAAAAERFAQPGVLARVGFRGVFINPDEVVVTPIEYPQVADGSFAATLNGKIDVNGSPFDLTILVVSFRSGNTTAAVGSARSGSTPPTDELAPYVDLVAQRIAANQ